MSAARASSAPPIALRLRVGAEEIAIYGFPPAPSDRGALTEAELAVAAALIAGASGEEIARARRTSARTVANQIAAIHRKLRVGSRMALLRLCHFVP